MTGRGDMHIFVLAYAMKRFASLSREIVWIMICLRSADGFGEGERYGMRRSFCMGIGDIMM